MAIALSKSGFNVTCVMPYDMELKGESETLKKIPLYIS